MGPRGYGHTLLCYVRAVSTPAENARTWEQELADDNEFTWIIATISDYYVEYDTYGDGSNQMSIFWGFRAQGQRFFEMVWGCCCNEDDCQLRLLAEYALGRRLLPGEGFDLDDLVGLAVSIRVIHPPWIEDDSEHAFDIRPLDSVKGY